MRIISKFKDYYDHIGHEFGEDPKIIFNRNPIVHNENILKELVNATCRYTGYRIPNAAIPNATIHGTDLYEFRRVSINGHLWLIGRLNGSRNSFEIFNEKILSHINAVNNERARYPYYGREKPKTEDFINCVKYKQQLICIHKKLGTPIFVFDEHGFGEKLSETNGVVSYKAPMLAEFGFASHYPAYQIFQDLCHFIGNELRDAPDTKPPVEISDSCKIEGHGFDKKISFRHRKPD